MLVVARAPRSTASRGNATRAPRAAPVSTSTIVSPSFRPTVQKTTLPLQPLPQRYELVGGGPGVGQIAYSGCEVELVAMSEKSGWATVRLVSVPAGQLPRSAKLTIGDELRWQRTSLRAVLPDGELAADAPTRAELLSAPMDAPPPLPKQLLLTQPEQQLAPVILPQPKQQSQPAQRYVLVGGGPSISKADYCGCEVEFVGMKASWATVRVVSLPAGMMPGSAAPSVGDEVPWRRASLRAVLPGGVLATEAPSLAELRVTSLEQPPKMPVLLTSAESPVARVVVLFDLESKKWGRRSSKNKSGPWTITQMAATAVFVLEDGTWGVPLCGRFSEHVTRTTAFQPVGEKFIGFIEKMSAAAGGKQVVMLAHNGATCDWPVLTSGLVASGLALPACVEALGCSRKIFVAELKELLGRKWSMKKIYAARFDGAKIPEHHQALADVFAMERIAVNVIATNGPEWAAAALEATVQRCKSPAAYVAKHEEKYGSPRSLVPSPLPLASQQLQLRSADPVALLAAAPALAEVRKSHTSSVMNRLALPAVKAAQVIVRAIGEMA